MSEKRLLIVFVKNAVLGTAKTRLAKTIGDKKAFEVYKHLMQITENATSEVENCTVHVYFSSEKDESRWPNHEQFVQRGNDLGERMKDAFRRGFDMGFKQIVGIGADLPDLTPELIEKGFAQLGENHVVFGPADDGGYYLVGMTQMINTIFEDKPWSQKDLLLKTRVELIKMGADMEFIDPLNDIDTEEDLLNSSLSEWYKNTLSDSSR